MDDRRKRNGTRDDRRSSGSRRSTDRRRDIVSYNRDELLREYSSSSRRKKSDSKSSGTRKPKKSSSAKQQKTKKPDGKKNHTVRRKKAKSNPMAVFVSSFDLPRSEEIDSGRISRKTLDRQRRNTVITNVFAAVVFIVVLVYLIGFSYVFLKNASKKVENDTVVYGSIDMPQAFQGVIIRSEKVFTAGKAGIVNYKVAENEKVTPGTVICTVSDESVVSAMEDELEKINENILKLQESRKEISIYTEDVKKYNQQIKDNIDEVTPLFTKNDISQLYTLKNNVQKKVDVRNQMLLSESNGSLAELSGKKQAQEAELAKNISNISTDTSGIVSYYSDGLETAYTPEKMTSLTKEQTLMDGEENTIKTETTPESPVFKVVTSNQWYIAAYIDNKYVDNWAVGENHVIYLKDNYGNVTDINTVVELITTLEKESYVVLRSDKYMSDYIDKRSVTFETEKVTEGYKIPERAVVEQTLLKIPKKYVDTNKLYKTGENGEKNELSVVVSTEADDKENVYIPMEIGRINVGDTVVSPSDSSDTFKINDVLTKQGIFVMNTGVAEFVVINTENAVSDGTYIILDPSKNPNIKIYDKIVTDTANVEKQQRIYG